jgi:hypothetical protein
VVDDTGTYFAIPLATADAFLGNSGRRMLLIVGDSGGFETNCASHDDARLQRMRDSGVFVGLVNLGTTSAAFHGSQAFDRTMAAPNAQALIGAVATIYQQFLGSKKVQTGAMRGAIRVRVDPYVSEAFLVVAADGAIASLEAASGNPGAGALDNNFRGGGSTRGLDGQTRNYRIVKLTNPNPGDWEFDGTAANGGWMLIQQSAITLRAVAGQQIAADAVSRVDLEAIDERTGKRITDPGVLAGLKVSAGVDGQSVALRNNNDGTFSFDHRFANTGQQTVMARLSNDVFDRDVSIAVTTISGGWQLTSLTPATAITGQPITLKVKLDPIGRGAAEPNRIVAHLSSGDTIELRKQGDGTFSADWNPSKEGAQTIRFEGVGGQNVAPIEVAMNVAARGTASNPVNPNASATTPSPVAPAVPTPPPPPPPKALSFRDVSGMQLNFGRHKSRDTASGTLQISGIPADGQTELLLDTDLPSRGIHLEIQGSNGWIELGSSPTVVKVTDPNWALRLRVGSCPAACKAGDQYHLNASLRNAGGMSDVLHIPLQVEVQPDPWLTCNWPYLAALGAALILGFISYGFYSPWRFPRRVGLQLSPEIDLGEGFFYALRGQPGARAGFYRNARLFISDDFRISGKNNGAFAKLRAASHNKVYITPCGGREVWRQRIDGEWERLPDTETVAPVGAPFRNDNGTVFFDVRVR